MKKTFKICTLLLAIALAFSLLTVLAFASDDGAKSGEKNVAIGATVIGDRGPNTTLGDVFWSVSDHYDNAVDGDPDTVVPLDTTHWKPYGLWITLEEAHHLSRLEIQTYGIGRAETSKGSVDQFINRRGTHPIKVTLYNVYGQEIFVKDDTASSEANTVIDLSDVTERVAKIYIYIDQGSIQSVAQGIWEVYAWSEDIHDWQDVEVIEDPSCTLDGIKAVKCAECGEEAEMIVPPTGHKDTCLGKCANGCGFAMEIKHQSVAGCSPTCIKCGKDEVDTSGSHVQSTSDPCDSSCVQCGATDVFDAPHVHDVNQPCNNDCVKCGATDVIPDAYDIGARITRTDWVLPYTYAPHVASTTDPCSSTCAACGKVESVRPVHVLPADPCNQTTCGNANCYSNKPDYIPPVAGESVFAHYSKSNLINEPHVRPEHIYGEQNPDTGEMIYKKDPVTNTWTCRLNCAKGHSGYVLSYDHQFTNCGDKYCDCCGGEINIDERAHRFTAESPIVCVDCGQTMKGFSPNEACVEHVYDNECDAKCNVLGCGFQRYNTRTGPMDYWHIYDNPCDTTCNDCEATREIVHTYPDHACAELCVWCGEKRATGAAHTYSDFIKNGQAIEGSNACDDTCDVCGEKREITHKYPFICAPTCRICQSPNPNSDALHTWSNACDTDCNNPGCFITREASHEWDHDCDTECNICSQTRETTHKFTSICDKVCDVVGCGYENPDVKAHKYQNACDNKCDNEGCTFVRTVETDATYDPDHDYDNDCDTLCNICNLERTVADHVYDNDCDDTCNICNKRLRTTSHSFSAWVESKEPTAKEDGEQIRACTVCGATEKQTIPAKGGLSTGGIVAIVISSVAVLGGGGFSVWWFVLRKKFIG